MNTYNDFQATIQQALSLSPDALARLISSPRLSFANRAAIREAVAAFQASDELMAAQAEFRASAENLK